MHSINKFQNKLKSYLVPNAAALTADGAFAFQGTQTDVSAVRGLRIATVCNHPNKAERAANQQFTLCGH